jgi:hypothetical protein
VNVFNVGPVPAGCSRAFKLQALKFLIDDLVDRKGLATIDSIYYHPLNTFESKEEISVLLKVLYRQGEINEGPINGSWICNGSKRSRTQL